MRKFWVLAAFLILRASVVIAADPPLTDGVSGAPVTWSEWLQRRAPVAALVWASWAPGAEEAIASVGRLEQECERAGLEFVVLDVQESLADGRAALAGRDVEWIHDRHGALLKRHRVIVVPSLVMLEADGSVVDRLDPTAEAVRAWAAR